MKKRASSEPKTMEVRFPNEDGTVDIWVYDTTKRPIRVICVTLNVRERNDTKRQHSKKK